MQWNTEKIREKMLRSLTLQRDLYILKIDHTREIHVNIYTELNTEIL